MSMTTDDFSLKIKQKLKNNQNNSSNRNKNGHFVFYLFWPKVLYYHYNFYKCQQKVLINQWNLEIK
jgi:hypothetical protein